MANRDIDPETFTAGEQAAWDSVARAWSKWWPRFEAAAQPLNDRLVALAGVAPGHRVLDIATGIGEPSVTAAQLVGPTGHVLACDLSSIMLEIGRERAADVGLTNIEFAEENACAPAAIPAPVPAPIAVTDEAALFDAAVCRWGLMLMLDPAIALQRVHERLRPGAKFAAAVWSRPQDAPLISLAGCVLRRELDLPAPDPEAPGPFRLCDPDALPTLLVDAGFRDVVTESFIVGMEFDSADQFVAFITEISSSARKVLADADAATRHRLLDAIAAESGSYALADGRIRFENRTLCATGTHA
jgi:enediyne biosynthesis protein CalE5